MQVTIRGKRGGTKVVNVRTIPQLEEALRRTSGGFDRKHEQMILLGSFIAERLVEIETLLAGRKSQTKRSPSEWQRYFAAGIRAGKSATEIGREWQERKVSRVSA